MFVKIPFENTLEFNTSIYEITKMSLEHEFNVNEGVVLGNFYITGEYRSHEVSVNKEPFKFTLPFTVELNERIDNDTLEFNIEDFSYDIVDDNKLKVNIEYSLEAEEKKEEREEESKDELFQKVEDADLDSEVKEIEEILAKEEVDSKKEDVSLEEERLSVEEEKTVMDTIAGEDDTFVTYHVHVVMESETLESICSIYNVPVSLIKEYNNVDSISTGDKILIPTYDE